MNHGVILAGLVSAALTAAAAQAGPDYYAVSGVSADKLLNVRMAPDADAPIISAFHHDAAPIEIVRVENGWGLFPAGEFSGWVDMSFLTPVSAPKVADTPLPEGMSCVGTEPFWVAVITSEGVTFSHQNWGDSRSHRLDSAVSSPDEDRITYIVFESGSAAISPGQCYDGMSDAEFGWRGDFVLGREDDSPRLRGCCKLSAPIVDGDPPGYARAG
ncbi:SH3 domain-containing protein [Alkalicaulis satelles]|nr:SH3 domain-containing protein [Alkalicaulis satelles]